MNKKSFRLILSNEMTRENILIYCTDNRRLHEKVIILQLDQLRKKILRMVYFNYG